MKFAYKGIDFNGKKVSGEIESTNIKEAENHLKNQKIIFEPLTEIKEKKDFKLFNRKKDIDTLTLSNICRDISIYLSSGMQISKALSLLSLQYKKDKNTYNFINIISTKISEGKTFYQSIDTQTIYEIPDFVKQSIKVAEENGILSLILKELQHFLEDYDKIKKGIKSSLAYPMFIIVVSIVMVSFMLSFVVPKIVGIFSELQQELPTITKIVIKASDFISNYGITSVMFIIISVLFLKFLIKTSKNVKYKIDSLLLKMPFFGKLNETSDLSRFSYISSLLLKTGIPLVKVITLSGKIVQNEVLKKIFDDASVKVVEGQKLSKALQNKDFELDEIFIQAIKVGEETSELSSVLENASKMYNVQNENNLKTILSLLEPTMMVIVGGIIGLIVASMLLPIFSMNLM